MQPPESIPPLDPEKVKRLVRSRCKVPVLSNPNKFWWVEILSVDWVTFDGAEAMVTVKADHHKFGNARRVRLSECRWKNHSTEPLVVAAIKAKFDLNETTTH